MADADCIAFLQWALPRLGRRWAGYKRVRRQVCRRVRRRAAALGERSLEGYKRRLEEDPGEWEHLDALTHVTVSRFHRDRGVFAFLTAEVLPALAAEAGPDGEVRAWSAGCASGEEPYTLAIAWELAVAPRAGGAGLSVLATDVDPAVLARAERARYPSSALRDLPAPWREAAFVREGDEPVLLPRFRRGVAFARRDVRGEPPPGPFDLVLCRNLAFTYFDERGQRETLERLARAARPGAALVVGSHERLPQGEGGFAPWAPELGVHRRARRSYPGR